MNKTTHYHLNQWEGEDRILRADFNADNAALDGALHRQAEAQAALEGALEAEQQARTAGDAGSVQAAREAVAEEETARKAAVAAEADARSQQDAAIRSEVSAAVAGAKSEAAGALEAERTARTGQDAAIRQEFAAADLLVKLREITTTAAATQVDVDLGGIDLNAYWEIIIVPRLSTGDDRISIRANGIHGRLYMGNGTSDCFGILRSFADGGYAVCRLYAYGNSVACRVQAEGWTSSGGMSLAGGATLPPTSLAVSALRTLNFVSSSGGAISAGGKFNIYGVRL